MSLKDFFSHIAASEETPCRKYACAKQLDCAEYKLTCDAWVVYVETGRAIDPHIELSDGRQLSTKVRNAKRLQTIQPDRATFLQVEAS